MPSRILIPAGDMAETRTRQRFAWLPVRLSDGTRCHLGWYALVEEFDADYIDETRRGLWSTVQRYRTP